MQLVGHRGAREEAPENTLTGFSYARRLGVEAFEFDVHLSGDAELVVIHDPTVDRTTNGTGPVSSFTAAELGQLDARAAFPEWPEPAGVPMLAAVLDLVSDAVLLEIEIKTDSPDRLETVARTLLAMIDRYGIAEKTIVTSFDAIALAHVQRMAPAQARGFIGTYQDQSDIDTALRLGCVAAGIPLKTGTLEIVRAARDRGLTVGGWQGNSPDALETLIDWQVDRFTTDYPAMAMAYLASR